MVEPTAEEVKQVAANLNLEYGHLTDALDPNEVPRLEEEDGVPYIFIRVPHLENDKLLTVPILFVMGEKYILSVSLKETGLFAKFFESQSGFATTQKIKLFILMMKEVNNRFNRSLTNINREIYTVSNSPEKISNKDILNLAGQEQVVNDYLNALIRANSILNNLLSGKLLKLYEEDRELIEDLFLANGQLVELAKNTLQTVKNLRDAYSTILTNNLNRVMKLFTVLTVVLTIPTIISSFFGMNVGLPGAANQGAFFYILAATMVLSLILVYVFYRKDWL